jgi:CRP-like cAMP-binding protein
MKQVKVYGDFTSFGELALITNKRRKAKLETIEDTHFAILSKEDYK